MSQTARLLFALIASHLGMITPAIAQEFSAQGGTMGTGATHGTSYSWQLDYRTRLTDRFAWSAAWINEGHTATHHRDGLALQAWGLLWSDPDDFALALGAGAYSYADTHFLPGGGYANAHGTTPIFSLSATYYTDSPWFLRLTANHINEADGLATNTLVAGVGYQLGWQRRGALTQPRPPRVAHRVTAMFGRTIVNSRSSEQAAATLVEYRRAVGRHADWTFTYLDEGDPRIMHREGVATQFWLVDPHPEHRLAVGLGLGPYFCLQREGPPTARTDTEDNLAVMISPTLAFRLAERWSTRLTWNRVISRDDRDADVIVVGLGYRWGTK